MGHVQGALQAQLGSVNQVAEHIGIYNNIRGGGGSASASRAPLQVEQRAAADTEVTAAHVQGVIEVLACDQLRVARGDSIQAMLSDKHKLEALQPAFQQVSPNSKLTANMNAVLLAWLSLVDGCGPCLMLPLLGLEIRS